jgi:CSLREA domain-containing protein
MPLTRLANVGILVTLAALMAVGVFAYSAIGETAGARAAAIVVDTVADELNGQPGNGSCSLREAIENANSNTGSQADCAAGTPGTDTVSFAVTGTITLVMGPLSINDNLAIEGPGASILSIDGNDSSTVLRVGAMEATIAALTVRGGSSTGNGGGIANFSGSLTLTGVTVSGNSASVAGGGLTNIDPTAAITLIDSTVSENHAVLAGGGISGGSGAVTLIRSTISRNTADGSSGAVGGGISLSGSGRLTLAARTVSGNRAGTGAGGGVSSVGGTVSITNSTISGNEATDGRGGGIYSVVPGSLTLTNTTVSGNKASDAGGIWNSGGSLTLANTIVAENTPLDCVNSGSLSSGGSNLDSDGSCELTAAGDIPGGAANLAPLGPNGGPTETQALLPGSDAIDSGKNDVCLAEPVNGVDQRGVSRQAGIGCDIGAFELERPPEPTATSPPAVSASATPPVTVTVVTTPLNQEVTATPTVAPPVSPGPTPTPEGGDSPSTALVIVAVIVVAGALGVGYTFLSRRSKQR